MTKKSLLEDIKKLTEAIEKKSNLRLANEYKEGKTITPYAERLTAKVNKVYGKNLEGRYYIHSKVTKKQLEGLLEDLINLAYDNRVISSAYDI